ncbi:hypothetical protein OQA88_5416 [Cercophora sp. LCS_1]
MAPTADFPPIRACIFDMDGLLINSEDIITLSINELLQSYRKPPLPRSLRAQMMGVPNSSNSDLFHNWAQLPTSRVDWAHTSREEIYANFTRCEPLPGAMDILSQLSNAANVNGEPIELALASTTKTHSYHIKTSRTETKQLMEYFKPERRILGDDERIPAGRGKPAPDIYLLALEVINASWTSGSDAITPKECLVFGDSAAGVEAARRAGMRVIWVPHADLAAYFQGRKEEILAGRLEA